MTDEEIVFNKMRIPDIVEKNKKDYGNKYQKNRNTVSVIDKTFKKLNEIQDQKKFKTKGELFEYLIDLENGIQPLLEVKHECKKCGGQLDLPKNVNIDRLIHRDLDKDSNCSGSILCKFKIKKDADGVIIEDKLKNDNGGGECPNCHQHKLMFNRDIIQCTDCNKKFKLIDVDVDNNDSIKNNKKEKDIHPEIELWPTKQNEKEQYKKDQEKLKDDTKKLIF